MARRKYLGYELEEDEPTLDIAPLIDVSFLLLIYFIITSTLQPREGDLDITFPSVAQTPTDEPVPVDPMTIHLRKDGNILGGVEGSLEALDEDPNSRDLPLLLEKLKTYSEAAKLSNSKTFVIVKADDEAEQQRFIDIINALAEVEITNVTMTGFRDE